MSAQKFPINLDLNIYISKKNIEKNIKINSGLTVLIGPNGSGKTHILRAIKSYFQDNLGITARFLSAGRIGQAENYRSDYQGYGSVDYDSARHGSRGDINRRHLIETIDGDLQTLSQRSDILIKVQERLRKLFKRDIFIEWDAGSLKVKFAKLDTETEPYSSAREASGLLHLVGLLSAIYDDEISALLIDEPEVSLHPQLQAFLLKEIIQQTSRGKIFVIATHSTEFIQIKNPSDLSSLIFISDLDSTPTQIEKNNDVLKGRNIESLVGRLGQEHKISLFSKRPLLVEGPSDSIIVAGLANKLNIHLEAAGSQVLPVVGKGQMVSVTKLMRLLGKQPVVLADADAFTDDLKLINHYFLNSPEANSAATDLGAASACDLAKKVHSDFCRLVDEQWDSIKEFAENHYYWENRSAEGDISYSKRRAAFSTLFAIDMDNALREQTMKPWLDMRSRLNAILNISEMAGLFFLRRGTVESYFTSSEHNSAVGKPSAAATEVDSIKILDGDNVRNIYGDILRAMSYAASTKDINEAEALRDILLAIAAPAQAKLFENSTTQDVKMMSRGMIGERSSIFDLSIKDGNLVIDLKSKILDVSGFPITIKKEDNVTDVVIRALGLAKNQ